MVLDLWVVVLFCLVFIFVAFLGVFDILAVLFCFGFAGFGFVLGQDDMRQVEPGAGCCCPTHADIPSPARLPVPALVPTKLALTFCSPVSAR